MVITKVLAINLPISQEFPCKVSVIFFKFIFWKIKIKAMKRFDNFTSRFSEAFYQVINKQMTAYCMKRKTVIANKSLHNIK